MNTKLITALRTAASAIEAGTFPYLWNRLSQCNCGALFCALTGLSPVAFGQRIPGLKDEETWTDKAGKYCPVTGIPEQELFRELFSYGLTQKDILNLEFLNNPKVLTRIKAGDVVLKSKIRIVRCWPRFWKTKTLGDNIINFKAAKSVIVYMRAWADLLTEEGRLDSVAQGESHENKQGCITTNKER